MDSRVSEKECQRRFGLFGSFPIDALPRPAIGQFRFLLPMKYSRSAAESSRSGPVIARAFANNCTPVNYS
ncbi:hypothetical protein ABIE71_000270 [Bradyrhizobium diazoefficiens]